MTPVGFAAPDAEHASICANLAALLQAQLRLPRHVHVGTDVVVDRVDANVPDVAVSSPKTSRIDAGRKIADYLAISTLAAYLVVAIIKARG